MMIGDLGLRRRLFADLTDSQESKSEVSASPTEGHRDGHGSVVGIFALVRGTVGVLGANAASHSTSAENAIRKSRLCRRIDANTIKVV
jgi:hypothetical protein